jgi:hypothetical protein
VVRLAGLEPARVTPLPPQSSVSANSTISATKDNIQPCPRHFASRFCIPFTFSITACAF